MSLNKTAVSLKKVRVSLSKLVVSHNEAKEYLNKVDVSEDKKVVSFYSRLGKLSLD